MGTFHAFVGTFSEAGVGSEGSMWCTITSIVVMFSQGHGVFSVAYTQFPTGKSAQGVNRKELTNWNGHKMEEVLKKGEV